jgi:hypothetical protein
MMASMFAVNNIQMGEPARAQVLKTRAALPQLSHRMMASLSGEEFDERRLHQILWFCL